MRKLLCLFVLLLCVTVSSFSQKFLGKTKEQVKRELTKDFEPQKFSDCVGVREEGDEFTRFWWTTPSSRNIHFYAYFNKSGVCILEQIALYNANSELVDFFINFHKEKPDYYFYTYEKGQGEHQFVSGKIMVELVTDYTSFGTFHHFWFFNPSNKGDVLKYFNIYYEKN